jgi:signal transduction histidine kinase
MTLRSRLAVGLVTIAIILVAPLVLAIRSLDGLREDAKQLRDRDLAASLLIGRLRDGINDLRNEELAVLFTKSAASRASLDTVLTRIRGLVDSLGVTGFPDAAKTIGLAVTRADSAAKVEYTASVANDTSVADSVSQHVFLPSVSRADSAAHDAERVVLTETQQRIQQESVRITGTRVSSIVALILAIVTAGIVAIWLTRTISEPITDLRHGMRAVADGDLTYRLKVPTDRDDEFGQLARSFQEMTRQLSELDKLKAEFVSVASHELKTPINVMIGYLQLLEEGVYGPLDPAKRDVLKTLNAQANTLSRLVRQLLDVSRFEAGGGRLEPRTAPLEQLLTDLENAFHVLAVQREIRFRVERSPGLPEEVHWDVDRINEVVGNLLSNAFKFTPHGGVVSLTLEPVDDSVLMKVCDTGAGIPPEQLPRIFDKFYQADNQRAARAAGSGLGLAIAKQIVEAHGGTISCESTLGVGTTFSIRLPTHVTRRTAVHRAIAAPV